MRDRTIDKLRRRDIADGAPVCGFTGINGAGKTLLLAQSVLHDLARGREVYSTVPIESEWGRTTAIESMRQLVLARNVTVAFDEIAVLFSSASSTSLPPEMEVFMDTMRHRGVTFRWSAPSWMRAHANVRRVTQVAVNVTPMMRSGGGLWPTPRIILAGALDTTQGKTDATPTRIIRRRIYRPSTLEAWGSYDTHADTPLFAARSMAGHCVDCHGSRTRPKCSPERHESLGLPYFDPDSLMHPRAALSDDLSLTSVGLKDETPA